MAAKIVATEERIGGVGQRREVVIPREMAGTLNVREGDFVAFRKQANGRLIKAKRVVDPDDALSPEESAQIAKGRREMRAGIGIPLWPNSSTTRLINVHRDAAKQLEAIRTDRHGLGTRLAVQKELLRHACIETMMNIYTQAVSLEKRKAASEVVDALWRKCLQQFVLFGDRLFRLTLWK